MNLSQEVLEVVRGIQEYNQPANNYTNPACTGISIGNEAPQEEQQPTGEQGYDTITPRLSDIDRAATIAQYGQLESMDDEVVNTDFAYYPTTVGVGRRAKSDGFLKPGSRGKRAYLSKSSAVDRWVKVGKNHGLKAFALITLKRDKINPDGTFSEPIRVLHVEYLPIS